MTIMRMIRRDPRTTMWLAIALVLAVGLAGATIGLIAESTGNNASNQAKAVADDNKAELACINQVLGSRNKPTHDEDAALKNYAIANAAQAKAAATYATANSKLQSAELAVLQAEQSKQAELYLVFLGKLKALNDAAAQLQVAATAYETASDDFQAAIQKVSDARAATPLGRCVLPTHGKVKLTPSPTPTSTKTPSLTPSGSHAS